MLQASVYILWLERPKLVCRPCNETLHDEYKYIIYNLFFFMVVTYSMASYSTD